METIIGKEFSKKVIPLIEKAKYSIAIIVYDWRWYPDQIGAEIQIFNNAIGNSRKKGLGIKVITNTKNTIKILTSLNIQAKELASKKMLHTKLMIIDDEIVILGSHNYTMNAFTTNYELSVILQDKEIVKRLKFYFENLWSY